VDLTTGTILLGDAESQANAASDAAHTH